MKTKHVKLDRDTLALLLPQHHREAIKKKARQSDLKKITTKQFLGFIIDLNCFNVPMPSRLDNSSFNAMSDGFAISVSFSIKRNKVFSKSKNPIPLRGIINIDNVEDFRDLKRRLDSTNLVAANDPGVIAPLSIVRSMDPEDSLIISKKQWRHETRHLEMQRATVAKTSASELDGVIIALNAFDISSVQGFENYLMLYRINFVKLTKHFQSRFFLEKSYQRYKARSNTLDKITAAVSQHYKRLDGSRDNKFLHEKTVGIPVCFYGAAACSRGNTPQKTLKERLSREMLIVLVNEYQTSQRCPCGALMEPARRERFDCQHEKKMRYVFW